MKTFALKDFVLIGVLLVVAGGFFAWQQLSRQAYEDTFASITLNGEVIKEVSLHLDQVFYVAERPNVRFEVRAGAIAFTHSDCRDQICVNAGFLHLANSLAACLPNGLLLTVHGQAQEGVDIFVSEMPAWVGREWL